MLLIGLPRPQTRASGSLGPSSTDPPKTGFFDERYSEEEDFHGVLPSTDRLLGHATCYRGWYSAGYHDCVEEA